MVTAQRSCARALSLCFGAGFAKIQSPLCSSRNPRQWQANPRGTRCRHSACSAAFLLSCRPRPIARNCGRRPSTAWRLWANHSLELSAVDARLENCPCLGRGQYGCVKACRVHPVDRPSIRRNLSGGWPAQRCCEHHNRGWHSGCLFGRACRHRQIGLHRLNRSWAQNLSSPRRIRHENQPRIGWQIALHHL